MPQNNCTTGGGVAGVVVGGTCWGRGGGKGVVEASPASRNSRATNREELDRLAVGTRDWGV